MASTTKKPKREFKFTRANFEFLRARVKEFTGISISKTKHEMVYGRIARRLRAVNLSNFDEYCILIDSDEREANQMVNAITTNLTSFFREEHHFQYLKARVLPNLIASKPRGDRIRIWSAGCSTGEEPYSIAMAALEVPEVRDLDLRILATDIDSQVLATGRSGAYSAERVEALSKRRKKLWFQKHESTAGDDRVQVVEEVRRLIGFKELNLMKAWPMRGPFDAIFCRNVMIYFDTETKMDLFDRFARLLAPEGVLFIGHSENAFGMTEALVPLGKTTYGRARGADR